MTRCTFRSCEGEVDEEDGFCLECGRSVTAATPPRSTSTGRTSSSRILKAADGLVSVPVPSGEDPSSRVISDPGSVRFRRKCRKGHSIKFDFAGQPAVLKGFCQVCREPFDFEPRLAPGDVVADQYEVVGPIAHGGLGWVFVARDRHLDGNHVALKGLIEPDDPVAVSLALSERQFLTSLDHPNIVRIYNFVKHDDSRGDRSGYIVMEYLNGKSLREILNDRSEPPELEHVLAYGYEILVALDYLHGRDLLYCDMKPDNVIVTPERIKLIDIGGVRRIDDEQSPKVITARYQADEDTAGDQILTVRSDVHTVGKTLEELFAASDPPSAGPVVESCNRLIKRACDRDRERRFESAAEMLEQLKGVLHEVRTLQPGHVPAGFEPSTMFEPSPALLDGGLSTVPPLERWTRDRAMPPLGGPPPAALIVLGLPVPKPDPADPAADLLASVGTAAAASLLDQLSEVEQSPEIGLRRCRAHLELREPDQAELCLAGAAGWRATWYEGLIALARHEYGTAFSCFDRVYGALPGETAPKLARACCEELLGNLDPARAGFDIVWRRDHSQINAAFGLARLRLLGGERSAAVGILDEVPRVAQHHHAARVAAVRILSEKLPNGDLPSAADLEQATRLLSSLILDGGEPTGKVRDRLTAAINDMRARSDRSDTVRGELEKSYRRLALQATTWQDKGRLVDLAHSVHPRSLL